MYSPGPSYNEPTDEHAKIWRYMDFTKFVSLLDKKALYFTRSDRFSDKFEGATPKPTLEARNALVVEGLERSLAESSVKELSRAFREARKWMFLNCWHMNRNESAAMWQLYVQKNEGIAIRSTFAKLRDSLSCPYSILIGMVSYIDYDKTIIPFGNAYNALFCKRLSFEHERELRAVVSKPSLEDSPPGLYIPCDLNILVDKIFVSPESPNWFKELVSSILVKYSFDREVNQSNLDEDPLF